jgi:hypothetical protein
MRIHFLCAGILLGATVVEADTFFSFDSGNELATIFSRNNSNLSQVSSGGVGNSGAVLVSGGAAGATYNQASFNFSQPGTVLSCSIFFKYQNPTESWYPIRLGFLSSPNTLFDANPNAMGVEVYTGLGGPTDLLADFGQGGSGQILDHPMVAGNWYRLSGTIVNLSSNLQITAWLDDFGTTGTTFVNSLSSFTRTGAPDGSIASDSTVWLAFEANSRAGAAMIDNLAVPEPRMAGLVFVALGIWMWGRSRNRQHNCNLPAPPDL